jgi:hypothetical protein
MTRHWRKCAAGGALGAAVMLSTLVLGGGPTAAGEPPAQAPKAFCADMEKTAQAGENLLAHPSPVAANRVTLASRVATNFLGQNTPAIMAAKAQYAELWAQDVSALLGYHQGAVSGETKPDLQMMATVVLEKVDTDVRRTCPRDTKAFTALTGLERKDADH